MEALRVSEKNKVGYGYFSMEALRVLDKNKVGYRCFSIEALTEGKISRLLTQHYSVPTFEPLPVICSILPELNQNEFPKAAAVIVSHSLGIAKSLWKKSNNN